MARGLSVRLKGDIELQALLAANPALRAAGGDVMPSPGPTAAAIGAPPARTPIHAEAQATLLELRRWTCTLPLPPSNNSLYRVDPKTGHTFLLEHQREYRRRVIGLVRFGKEPPPMLTGRLEAHAHFYLADRRRLDIRNLVKALDDALVHAKAMRDDSQIDVAHEYRHLITDNSIERCEVVLTEIAQ